MMSLKKYSAAMRKELSVKADYLNYLKNTKRNGENRSVFNLRCKLIMGNSAYRNQQSADRVAYCDDDKIEQRINRPRTACCKVKHICDTVFIAAKYKCDNPEEKSEILAEWMRVIFKAVYCNKDKQIAEYRKYEHAQRIVAELYPTKFSRSFTQALPYSCQT